MMAVDVEGEMANYRFVTKTFRVCSGLVVVIYGQRLFLLLLERKALILEMKADSWHKNTHICFLDF